MPVLAGLFALFVTRASAATLAENFATDPQLDGWRIFGDTNLFQWNSTNQNLEITWDSTQSNSYFFHPLSFYLTRNDDFSIEFDLRLNDIASGVEPGKTGPMQLGFGLLNFANATSANFMRGAYGSAPDVAEFDYYPPGYYDWFGTFFDAPATTTPSFISGVNSFDYAPNILSVYDNELPTNQTMHIMLTYTASNQTAVVNVTTNGVPLRQLPSLVLDSDHGFVDSDDFHVDIFSISSYSSSGDDFDSVLAHGSVDNLVVTLPPPAQNLAAACSNGVWRVQFTDHANWVYTLERSTDLFSWSDVSPGTAGNGTNLFLQDTHVPVNQAFYRVRAERP